MKYTDEEVESLLNDIYSGTITSKKLPKKLYKKIGEYFAGGVKKGFGSGAKDPELYAALVDNVWMFSAAKTYQQVKDIITLMHDESGALVGHKEFNRLGAERFEKWNKTWGATEYNTAVGQAATAANWVEIKANEQILPMLRYSAIGDACIICKPLDGLTAPVKWAGWGKISPLNHFNCLCVLLQEEGDVEATSGKGKIVSEVTKRMDKIFLMNPGTDGYVFNPNHPNFEVEKKDVKFARTNFGLPINDGR